MPPLAPAESPLSRPLRGRRLLALLLATATVGVVAAIVYARAAQPWLYDDGYLLRHSYSSSHPTARHSNHIAYLFLARSLGGLIRDERPFAVLSLLSVLAGAGAVAATFARAFVRHRSTLAAIAAAAVIATAPVVAFFATVIEVHVVHLCFVAVGLLVVDTIRWRRAWTAHVAMSLVCAGLFFSHQTGALLVPAFVFAAYQAQLRQGVAAPPFVGLARLTAVAAVATAIAIAVAWRVRGVEGPSGVTDFIRAFHTDRDLAWFLRFEFAAPLAGLLVGAVAAVVAAPKRIGALAPLALALLPTVPFFTMWGVATLGGYFIGLAPFLAGVIAETLSLPDARVRRSAFVLACVILATNVWLLPQPYQRAFGGFDSAAMRQRAERAALALSEPSYLVTFQLERQSVEVFHPHIREISLAMRTAAVVASGEGPSRVGRALASEVALLVSRHPLPVAFDGAIPQHLASHPYAAALTGAFVEHLESAFGPLGPPVCGTEFAVFGRGDSLSDLR